MMRCSTGGVKPAANLTAALLLLFGLAATASTASAQNDSLRMRRVWKGGLDNICCHVFPRPSPDGRYVPGVDWITGDLAYLDLQEDRWIHATEKGPWEESAEFSMNAIFSRDGTQMAHTWFTPEGVEGFFEIRAQNRDGGNGRVLVPRDLSRYAWPLDWSPDGRFVLAVLTPAESETHAGTGESLDLTRMVIIPAEGGRVRVIKELGTYNEIPNPMARFSPDGRWIAYEEFGGDPPFWDIHLLSVDGTVDRPLVTGNGDDRLLGWWPDGSGILFHSERDLTQGIWRQEVQEGSPSGGPELLKGDVWGITGMGFGPKGLYYMVPTESPQVYTATVDLTRGELLSPPNPVREITDGAGLYPSWSPDGRQLAFVDRGPPGTNRSRLVIQSLETGESLTLSVPIEGLMNLQWHPDGRNVTGIGSHRGILGFYSFHLQTGGVETLMDLDESRPRAGYRLSRDGSTVLYASRVLEKQMEIREWDLEAKVESVIATVEGTFALVSDLPGGGGLAVWTTDYTEPGEVRLLTMNSDGTDVRTLWDGIWEFSGAPQMEFTPDGKNILLTGNTALELNVILSFDVVTGEHRVIELGSSEGVEGAMRSLTVHPDGSRIAFWKGVAKGEIWLLEGF